MTILEKPRTMNARFINANQGNNRRTIKIQPGIGEYDGGANGIWYKGCLLTIRHITLAEAEEIMAAAMEADRNVRNPSKATVNMLAQEMKKGQFDFPCSSFLAFDPDGFLIDGQTRLGGQIKSGTDQDYVCIYFVENYIHFDTGTKRTARQVFKKKTGLNLPIAPSLARAVITDLECGSPLVALRQGYNLNEFRATMVDMLELAAEDATVQACALMAGKQRCASTLAFSWAYYDALTRSRCPEQADLFFSAIASGDVFPGTMAQAAYKRLFEAKHNPTDKILVQDQAAFLVKCWNKHLRGQYSPKIHFRARGNKAWTPENFPRALKPEEL